MNIFNVNGKFDLFALLVSIILGEGMAFISKTLSTGSQNTYKNLIQPAWAPPGITFPIVWTILFFINAIAGYRIYMSKGKPGYLIGIIIYAVLLILNCTFTVILFRYGKMKLALIQLFIMWILIGAAVIIFHKIDKTSSFLFLPYFLWVTFAGFLFFNVNKLNS